MTLPELYSLVAPVDLDGRTVLVVPHGVRTLLLVDEGGGWSAVDGPEGTPVAAATFGDRIFVASRVGDGGTLPAAGLGASGQRGSRRSASGPAR